MKQDWDTFALVVRPSDTLYGEPTQATVGWRARFKGKQYGDWMTVGFEPSDIEIENAKRLLVDQSRMVLESLA